jgi:hypothetical protein
LQTSIIPNTISAEKRRQESHRTIRSNSSSVASSSGLFSERAVPVLTVRTVAADLVDERGAGERRVGARGSWGGGGSARELGRRLRRRRRRRRWREAVVVVVVVVVGWWWWWVCVCVGVESDNAPILILSPPSLGVLASKTSSASNQANCVRQRPMASRRRIVPPTGSTRFLPTGIAVVDLVARTQPRPRRPRCSAFIMRCQLANVNDGNQAHEDAPRRAMRRQLAYQMFSSSNFS